MSLFSFQAVYLRINIVNTRLPSIVQFCERRETLFLKADNAIMDNKHSSRIILGNKDVQY